MGSEGSALGRIGGAECRLRSWRLGGIVNFKRSAGVDAVCLPLLWPTRGLAGSPTISVDDELRVGGGDWETYQKSASSSPPPSSSES